MAGSFFNPCVGVLYNPFTGLPEFNNAMGRNVDLFPLSLLANQCLNEGAGFVVTFTYETILLLPMMFEASLES